MRPFRYFLLRGLRKPVPVSFCEKQKERALDGGIFNGLELINELESNKESRIRLDRTTPYVNYH